MKPPLANGSVADPDYQSPEQISATANGQGNATRIATHYPFDVAEPGTPSASASPPDSIPVDAFLAAQTPRGNPLLSNLVFLFMGALLASAGIFVTQRPTAEPIQIQPPPTAAPTTTPQPTATAEPITVFVSGAVKNPGLYELLGTPRVGDVLQMAGGILPDAEETLINQAERLYDGAQVHVPAAIQVVDVEGVQGESALPPVNNQPPAGISGAPAAAISLSNTGTGNLINVNTATAAELETLPSVGASRAAEIIAGRPYSTVDDLQKVSGIGAKTVEKLRPLVRVE